MCAISLHLPRFTGKEPEAWRGPCGRLDLSPGLGTKPGGFPRCRRLPVPRKPARECLPIPCKAPRSPTLSSYCFCHSLLPPPSSHLHSSQIRSRSRELRGTGPLLGRHESPAEQCRGSTWPSRESHDDLHTGGVNTRPTLHRHGWGHTAPLWEGRRVISSEQKSEHRLEWHHQCRHVAKPVPPN